MQSIKIQITNAVEIDDGTEGELCECSAKSTPQNHTTSAITIINNNNNEGVFGEK